MGLSFELCCDWIWGWNSLRARELELPGGCVLPALFPTRSILDCKSWNAEPKPHESPPTSPVAVKSISAVIMMQYLEDRPRDERLEVSIG